MKKILLLFIILFASCYQENIRLFNFTYEVSIESTNGKKIELWIPYPQSNEVQTISNINIDSDGLSYLIKDEEKHHNQYFYIYDEDGTTKAKNISITFDVKRKEHSNEYYKKVNPNNYLGQYITVPTGNIFTSIINENDLSKDDVRGIYDYVLSGMHYGKPKSIDNKYYKEPWLSPNKLYGTKKVSRDKIVELYKTANKENNNYTFGNGNSIYACDIGVGNCTDYHSYFMSIGRTLQIPVRFHMGFLIPSEKEGTVPGYHCWADYYVEGEGWYPVDISNADKEPGMKNYYFGTIGNNRVDMMIGRDFILDGYDNGKLNLFIYPILEVEDKKSAAFSKKFTYKDF